MKKWGFYQDFSSFMHFLVFQKVQLIDEDTLKKKIILAKNEEKPCSSCLFRVLPDPSLTTYKYYERKREETGCANRSNHCCFFVRTTAAAAATSCFVSSRPEMVAQASDRALERAESPLRCQAPAYYWLWCLSLGGVAKEAEASVSTTGASIGSGSRKEDQGPLPRHGDFNDSYF